MDTTAHVKRAKRTIRILIGFFLILFAAGSFIDLPLAERMYMPMNRGWLLVTSVGLWLYCMGYVFLCGVLYGHAGEVTGRSAADTKRFRRGCVMAFLAAGVLCTVCCLQPDCFGSLFDVEKHKLLWYAGFFLVPVLPVYLIAQKLRIPGYNGDYEQRVRRLMLALLAAFLFVQFLKSALCRPRYRLVAADETVRYWDWFRCAVRTVNADGIPRIEDYYSFPSGHSVAVISYVAFFPAVAWVFPRLRGHTVACMWLGFGAALLVMISRLFLGAHYLTDVAAASLIGLIAILWYIRLEEKRLRQPE